MAGAGDDWDLSSFFIEDMAGFGDDGLPSFLTIENMAGAGYGGAGVPSSFLTTENMAGAGYGGAGSPSSFLTNGNMAGAGDGGAPSSFLTNGNMAGAGNGGVPSYFLTNGNMAGARDGGAPTSFTNGNMAGVGNGGAPASSFLTNGNMAGPGNDGVPSSSFNNMDALMSGGSSSTVYDGTPLDDTVGTGEDGLMSFSFSDLMELAAASGMEFDGFEPELLWQGVNVVMGERGPERMQVETVAAGAAAAAVGLDTLTPQPPVQNGNVVTRKMGAERMEVAGVEPAASGSKKQRIPTGSKETTGGDQVSEKVAGKGSGEAPRRTWTKEHDESWWNEVSSSLFSAEEFKRLFRMSPATFEMVCGELAAAVARNDTALRQAIPVSKRVAVCIWRLATGDTLRSVAKRFGIGISTCQKISIEICAVINALLLPKFLLWPNVNGGGAAATAIAAEFEAAYGIPNIVGAIYNTHISIISPKADATAYYNSLHTKRRKKSSYSVTVQAVVDATGSFTHICVGHPGSMSDEHVLLNSSLVVDRRVKAELQAEGLWLVGGASYPLRDWMLTPYVGEKLTVVHNMLNSKVAGIRQVAMDAVMRFRARWSLLRKRNEINVDDLPDTLSACCVLHNICERHGHTLDPELAFDLDDDEMLARRPVLSEAASLHRDNIASALFLHGIPGDINPYISS